MFNLWGKSCKQLLEEQHKLCEDEVGRLRGLAYFDPLTKLPNRISYQEHAITVLERARKQKIRFAMFLIDIDGFKRVNDTFGHIAGDQLLAELAERLTHVVNLRGEAENDCKCFAARLGGDEFILIIENISNVEQAKFIAEQLYAQANVPFLIGGQLLRPTISVGISLYPFDGSDIHELMKSADLALYAAKARGKNQYVFHETTMNVEVEQSARYENILRYFLETEDFTLRYQPIISTQTGKIASLEALFDGNKEKHKNLKAYDIIRAAEDTGLIIPLGQKILYKACEDITVLHAHNVGTCVSVNLSIRHLEDKEFLNTVLDTLATTGAPNTQLALEITETIFMRNYERNVRSLKILRSTGIRVAIDDFGIGYSSMSYLRDLPIDRVKIDASFIRQITSDEKSAEIAKAMILIAQTLGVETCAEGVETQEQFNMLKDFGCDLVQGYYASEPISFNKVIELVDSLDTCHIARAKQRAREME